MPNQTDLDPRYVQLVRRLNRLPQGAPPSDSLYAILKILFTPSEALLVSQLPVKPFSVDQAARNWKKSPAESQKILNNLASRALLLDNEQPDGSFLYVLPPPMAGFFEFTLMRVRSDIDQQALSENYQQYCTVEDDFMFALFNQETQVGRIFVQEPLLPKAEVLDFERASEIIRSSTHRGIALCYCRQKAQTLDHVCDAPLDICMTLNGPAESLIRHGHARAVEIPEMLEQLHRAYEHNLVQFGENVQNGVNFICNCCACCCEALTGARRFSSLRPIYSSSFVPQLDPHLCTGCGKCARVCPVEAVSLVSAHLPGQPRAMTAKIDPDLCLGCGVCARTCPQKALSLVPRPSRISTPYNTTHRLIMMAIEKGKLQDLIFDNQVLWNQRTLAALLGAFLRLPPIKQALASKQVKSRFFEALVKKNNL